MAREPCWHQPKPPFKSGPLHRGTARQTRRVPAEHQGARQVQNRGRRPVLARGVQAPPPRCGRRERGSGVRGLPPPHVIVRAGRPGGPGGHAGGPHRGRPGLQHGDARAHRLDPLRAGARRGRRAARRGGLARGEHRRGGGEGACKGEPAAGGPDRHRVGVQGGADTAARGACHRVQESTCAHARRVHATLPVRRQEAAHALICESIATLS
mmetsp:Transcript_5219/g.21285  ORF Transcript_5219/g.21285 Transcript_5219/m.21285 type:complete len:211 (-) Transcript_5219:36-668(-)